MDINRKIEIYKAEKENQIFHLKFQVDSLMKTLHSIESDLESDEPFYSNTTQGMGNSIDLTLTKIQMWDRVIRELERESR